MGLIKSTEGFSIANIMKDFNQDYGVNCSGVTPQFNNFNSTAPNCCFSTNSLPQVNFETNNNIWNNWTIPAPNNIFDNNFNNTISFGDFKAFNTTPTIQPPSFKFDFNEYQIGTFYSNKVAQTTAGKSSSSTRTSTHSTSSVQIRRGKTSSTLQLSLDDNAKYYVGKVNSDAEGNRLFSPNGISQAWCADFVTHVTRDAFGTAISVQAQ